MSGHYQKQGGAKRSRNWKKRVERGRAGNRTAKVIKEQQKLLLQQRKQEAIEAAA